jgi:hypothetical protein
VSIIINVQEIVVENPQLPVDVSPKELRLYLKIVNNPFTILIQTLTPEILTTCPHRISPHEFCIYLHSFYYHMNTFIIHALRWQVILLPQDDTAYKNLLYIQLYQIACATLYRLTIITSIVKYKSELYQNDSATLFSYDYVNGNFLLASVIEKFPNKVNNISTKDASSFQEVKKKFLNLHSASGKGESAHHMFGNKKHT